MSNRRFIIIFIPILIAVIVIGVWSIRKFFRKPIDSLQKITFAVSSHSFTGYTIFVALEKGFFKDEGLEVTLQTKYPHGKAILKALIEKEADLGVTSETPFMHAVLNGEKIYALATILSADKHLAIVARKDREISTVEDLKGKAIGVTLGTNGEYFMETVLLLNSISREEIQVFNLKPGQMFDAIMKGEVDAIATWNPQMYKTRNELGEKGSTFYADGVYVASFVLAASQDYVHKNPEIVNKILQALITASAFIQANPEESREIAAGYLKMDPQLLKELSAMYHFKVSLNQSFLVTLENQSEWAIKHNLTDQKRIPNFLEFIYPDALETLKPESMTVIR